MPSFLLREDYIPEADLQGFVVTHIAVAQQFRAFLVEFYIYHRVRCFDQHPGFRGIDKFQRNGNDLLVFIIHLDGEPDKDGDQQANKKHGQALPEFLVTFDKGRTDQLYEIEFHRVKKLGLR